jgi:hypothetical protein
VNDARACRSWAQTQNHVAHVTRSNAARPAHQVLKPTGLSILTAGPTDQSPSLFLGRAGHPARGVGAGPNAQGRARRGAERPRGARREGLDQDSSGNQLYQDAAGVTIGRALEGVAAAASGDKAVDQSDAAAVQVAEMCAAGSSVTVSGRVAAAAQAPAGHNAHVRRDEDRVKLRDILTVRASLCLAFQFH